MTPSNNLFRLRLDIPGHAGEWPTNSQAPPQCVALDDTSQEAYLAFDPVHRAVLRFCVPNTGGEVLGVAAYFVDTAQWAWYPAPQNLQYPVMANVFAFSPACNCVISTGAHQIQSTQTGRNLPSPLVNWTFKLQ